MTDVGDLREGFWYEEELLSAALMAENDLDNIYLAGVGTNVGCYGAIEPTVETLEKLAETADKIEKKIGRPLDIISGGASSSLMRIWDKDMPEKINHLRIGGEVMLAYTNRVVYGYDMRKLVWLRAAANRAAPKANQQRAPALDQRLKNGCVKKQFSLSDLRTTAIRTRFIRPSVE